MKLRIGLPRAYHYYPYGPFWEELLKSWGAEVIISGTTTRHMLEEGAERAPEGACLPLKTFLGHAIELGRAKVDYLFIPRLIREGSRERFCCPKSAGLPELVKTSVPELPPILAPTVERAVEAPENYRSTACLFGVSGEKARRACSRAWRNYQSRRRPEGDTRPGIGILGHPYLTEDAELNFHLKQRIEQAGLTCLCGDEADAAESIYPKTMFWHSGEAANARLERSRQENWKGCIFLTAVGCGPDSCTELYCRRAAQRRDIPYMQLSLDEESGSTGFETRLEAFLDMIERRSIG